MSSADTPKRGRGRPPLPSDERGKNRTLRFSDKDWAALKAEAARADMSVAALIRSEVLPMLCLVLAMMGGCVPPGNWHDDGSGVLFDPEPFSTVERGLI
jgi:hypothetical protein